MSQSTDLLSMLAPDIPIILFGAPGTGKTAAVNALAQQRGHDLIASYPVAHESVDYSGYPSVQGDHAEWLPIGDLRRITAANCPPTIVFFDDAGQAQASVQAALMHIVLERRLGERAVAPSVSFVLAANRAADRSGARALLAALVNRCLTIEWAVDPNEWADWALAQPDVSPVVAGYLRFRPDTFAKEVPPDANKPWASPRSVAMAGRIMYRHPNPPLAALAGCIGAAAAGDLLTYAQAVTKLPAIDTILAAPERYKVPTDPGLVHALIVLAARKAMELPDRIIRLADHLGGGWGVTLVSSAQTVDAKFRDTAAFRQWAVHHQTELL